MISVTDLDGCKTRFFANDSPDEKAVDVIDVGAVAGSLFVSFLYNTIVSKTVSL